MLTKEFILGWLERSLRLDDSSTLQDQAYTSLKPQLPEIYLTAVLAHNPLYTEDNIPDTEVFFAVLMAKKEVYYRLATSSAPFYPIEAEGASLRKDYRFEHYMSLIRRVEQDYDSLWEKYESGQPVEVINVVIEKYHYTRRNYNSANVPSVTAKFVKAGTDYIDFQWTPFSVVGGLFNRYKVYVHTGEIYDEFEGVINPSAYLVADITDTHRTKLRIKSLIPETTYTILVVAEDRNGLKGYSQFTGTTEAIPVTP